MIAYLYTTTYSAEILNIERKIQKLCDHEGGEGMCFSVLSSLLSFPLRPQNMLYKFCAQKNHLSFRYYLGMNEEC